MFWRKKRRKKKTLRTRELILEDENGEERVRLGVDSDNNTIFNFKDQSGQSRLYLGLTQDGTPRVGLHYANGKGSIQLEASDKLDSAALIIVGQTGKVQVLLGVARNGHPAIVLYDDDGNQVFPVTTGGEGGDWNTESEGFDWDDILRR